MTDCPPNEPTTSEFLNAANWTYAANSPYNPPGYVPPYPADLQPLLVGGKQVTQLLPYDGFYGAAFVTPANQVIVALEGTSPDQIIAGTTFGLAQVAADGLIYFGLPVPAFQDAQNFTSQVTQDAAKQGIGTDSVFISGHSLGAAEAEYISAQTGIAGETFGGPGISQYLIGHPDTGTQLTDYIESGDPVGNYAADSATEGNFLFSQSILHYGATEYLGSYVDALPLYTAGALFGQSTDDTLTALGLLALNAAEFHPTTTYAASLGVNLTNPGPVYDYATMLLTLDKILGLPGAPAPGPSFLGASAPGGDDVGGTTAKLLAVNAIAGTSRGSDALAKLQAASGAAFLPIIPSQSTAAAAAPSLPQAMPAPAAFSLLAGQTVGMAIPALIQSQHA